MLVVNHKNETQKVSPGWYRQYSNPKIMYKLGEGFLMIVRSDCEHKSIEIISFSDPNFQDIVFNFWGDAVYSKESEFLKALNHVLGNVQLLTQK